MRIGPLFRLFAFFSGAKDYAREDPDALEKLGEESGRHQSYHRVIIICGAIGVTLGFIAGIVGAISAWRFDAAAGHHLDDAYVIILSPVLVAAAGMLAGASWAVLFAPASFLNGPLGTKWMRLVGSNNLAVARTVSFVIAILATGFCVVMVAIKDAKH